MVDASPSIPYDGVTHRTQLREGAGMQTLSVRIPDELKRLPSALKRALDAEIRKIAADPLRGDRKRGVLRDV